MNWEPTLTPLGQKMKAEREAMAAQANPAMMGIPQGGTGTGGQIKFDRNALMQAYQASMAGPDAGRWFRITGADGQSYAVAPNGGELAGYTGEGSNRQYNYGANTGFSIFSDPGDFGGGWLTDGPEAAKMNGRAYDSLDASGNYAGSGKFSNWTDSGVMGPWGALAVLAMPFAAAALGAGAGAAGAAGAGGMAGVAEAGFGAGMTGGAVAGGATGAAGAAATAAGAAGGLDLGGGIMMGADGAITGATPFATSALSNAGIMESVGAGGLASGAGAGALSGLNAVDLTGTGLPLDQAGSVIGSQAGGGTLSNAAIESIINGSAYAPALTGVPPPVNPGSSPGMPPGVPPPPNPNVPGTGGLDQLIPGITNGQLLGAAGSVIGGALGSNAASTAAEQQLQSTRESNALLERMFDKQTALQEPFRQNGLAAGNRMMTLLGIGGDPSAADYGSEAKSFGQPAPQWRDFTNADFVKDPGYDFRQAEGAKGVTNAYAGKGSFLSGAGVKALDRYTQDYASNEFGKASDRYQQGYTNKVNDYTGAFNRFQTERSAKLNPLQSVYGSGQTSANTLTNAAGTYGQNASQNIQAGGNAQAAGTVGSANAWSNTLNGIWNNYQQNELMNQLLRK